MTLAAPAPALPRAEAGDNLNAVAAWLLTCCAMIFAMVVIGGITRLTLSGLSITEWEPVTGVIPPLSHADWAAEFAKYQHIPQYKLLNAGMSLGDFKTIYLWEYVHRLWGRLIGVVYAVPLVYFLLRRRLPRRLVGPLAFILLLGFGQGLLGWYMVESGLANRVDVSQYRLTAHLALALLIYAAILWVALGILRQPRTFKIVMPGLDPGIYAPNGSGTARPSAADGRVKPGHDGQIARGWRRAGEVIIALVALTITAGGFTAGLHAGLVYNTFPMMDGRFVPAGYAQLEPFFRNWFENVTAVQFDHRLLAETTVASVLAAWCVGACTALPRPARGALHALALVALLQLTLGVSTLLFVVPIPLAAAHQAGAVLLLTAAIAFRHRLRQA
ncbi:MAG TPA: COX15/CtaA family protein [Stellaceae bacterium]|nr:COX15/CtaA family protein [Stellaceae bacterium]